MTIPANIYVFYMFAGIAIYGHSNHKIDITIEFTLKIPPEHTVGNKTVPMFLYLVKMHSYLRK